jgi:DNA invertase Pin-like site-specific DNA recombinase
MQELNAIAYYRSARKSLESIERQKTQVRDTAKKFGITIIAELIDDGVSGLAVDRPSFQRLFNEWVLNPNAQPFCYILIHDKSRWGRFQYDDINSNSYEEKCKAMGKEILCTSYGALRCERVCNQIPYVQ